jgi:hypothetical protein
VGRFNERTDSRRDIIEKDCEGKSEHADELLLLQATVQAILILIKKISDYSMTTREDSKHQGEGKECLPAMLELQLQLMALPYALPHSSPLSPPHALPHSLPSDERKDEEGAHNPLKNKTHNLPSSSAFSTSFSPQFAESSSSTVKGALRAFTQFSDFLNPAVFTTPTSTITSVPTSFFTSVPGSTFSNMIPLETLHKYSEILQIVQSSLAHLLLILIKLHLQPPLIGFNRPSDGPTPSEKTFSRGRKEDKNPVKKSLGSKPVQALNKGQVREREEVWFSLMIFCSNLQCIACTSSFLFFANHIPFSPPLPTIATAAAAAMGIECGTYEEDLIAHKDGLSRHISPSPSSMVSLLIAVVSHRARALARSNHSAGWSHSSDKSNCTDLRIVEELWSAVMYLLGHHDRNPLSPLRQDEMSYFLGRILCEWHRFQVPIEIFETRTLDLCVPDSTSESGMSQQGGLVTAALRQLLLRWRKRPPFHCVCGQPGHVRGSYSHPITYFRSSSTDTDPCHCSQACSKSSSGGEIDRRVTGPGWLLAVQKMNFSSRFLIKIML